MALCKHITVTAPSTTDAAMVRDLLELYTFPNVVIDDEQTTAMAKAVAYQWAHLSTEYAKVTALGQAVPSNVSGFKAAGFSMSFYDQLRSGNGLLENDICPYARSVLLRAGLLYKGVGSDDTCY